jgi:hypothetical protein
VKARNCSDEREAKPCAKASAGGIKPTETPQRFGALVFGDAWAAV